MSVLEGKKRWLWIIIKRKTEKLKLRHPVRIEAQTVIIHSDIKVYLNVISSSLSFTWRYSSSCCFCVCGERLGFAVSRCLCSPSSEHPKNWKSSTSRRSNRWFKSRKIILEDMCRPEGEWKDNNARKAQYIDQSMTTVGVVEESKDAWGRRGSWLFQSVRVCSPSLHCFILNLTFTQTFYSPQTWLNPDHLESRLVDDIQQVLGVHREGMSSH